MRGLPYIGLTRKPLALDVPEPQDQNRSGMAASIVVVDEGSIGRFVRAMALRRNLLAADTLIRGVQPQNMAELLTGAQAPEFIFPYLAGEN